VESKLQRLFALRDAEVRFQQIWARLEAAYPDFPESFFYLQLTAIPGIGAKLAQRLFKAGLRDIATTLSAPDSVLRSVGGVGPRLIQNIRNFVEVEQTE
jgi:ERCC4-type nuclease